MVQRRFDFPEPFNWLPKCAYSSSSYNSRDIDDKLQCLRTEPLDLTDSGKSLINSIYEDDKAQFIALSKKLFGSDTDSHGTLDRASVSKLLFFCCVSDALDCASALIAGEIGLVPLVNGTDETGKSPLHGAAEAHSKRCVEMLLKKRARTDLRTKDGRSLLALELSLSSPRMDVIWNPDDYSVEELVVCLSEKDLTTVKLLSEKTKDIAEVAYANAIKGLVVPLAALIIVAAEKVNESILELLDADSNTKEKTTLYECVIKEALTLGLCHETTTLRAVKRTCSLMTSERVDRRKLLLCEIELLQLFGAVAQTGRTDKKVTSPLIRASQAGDEAVINLLLKTSIDVNGTDAEGNSALHWSLKTSRGSSQQQMKIISLLLKHGAQVNQKNVLGLTAFHIAAANGNLQALQALISEDSDGINTKTEMIETPLFFAVKNDCMDCAELLLFWGANSEILNIRRQRPIDLAKSQDMRFILNSANMLNTANISFKTCGSLLTLTDESIPTERMVPSTKAEMCKFYESPGGCVRGEKCFYVHGDEELRQMKRGTHLTHYSTTQDFKRKVFVGGLPPLLDSDSLSNIFEEQFGSVEDARVVEVQAGNQIQSRGFGFVNFKQEKSVSAAVQAHYVTIMGKQVEVKSAIPKCVLLSENQKLSPQQEEQVENKIAPPKCLSPRQHQLAEIKSSIPQFPSPRLQEQERQPVAHTSLCQLLGQTPNKKSTEEVKPEPKSWVEKLLHGQPETCPNESEAQVSTTFTDKRMPAWFGTFRKWLPGFLRDVSKNLTDTGAYYPLSSLKGDFRATFGLELDHASLGYSKLSDFVKSVPDLCHMKAVPVSKCGPATHMVILPNHRSPHMKHLQPITIPCSPSCATMIEDNGYGDSSHSKFPQYPLLPSYESVNFTDSFIEGNQFSEVTEVNSGQKDTPLGVNPRFVQFLKPDLLFHARPWLRNKNDGGAGDTNDERGGCLERDKWKQLGHQKRHLVLETLARIRKNTSVFFLREFDFYDNYIASIKKGECFACHKRGMLCANFPCRHLLWCSDCKLHAIRAAGIYEHKCVVCDVQVQKIDLIPGSVFCQPGCYNVSNNDEFPPLDPNHHIQMYKKSSPLIGN